MQQQEHEKAFEKSLNYLAQRHGIRQVSERNKGGNLRQSIAVVATP